MYNPARTTRVFTGKVRPHKYLYRVPKPGGYYEYIYLEDIMEDKEQKETDPVEGMMQAFFIKVCKKIYGVKGEIMATRFINGQSITVTERNRLDKIIDAILKYIPDQYKEAFRNFIAKEKANA